MLNNDKIIYAHPYKICVDFLKSSLTNRDSSHGVEHALAVHSNCVKLWFHHGGEAHYYKMLSNNIKTNHNVPCQPSFDPWFYISASALLHDVCDHKYKTSELFEETFHNFILYDVCKGDKTAADTISIIIKYVSYSKEKKRFFETSQSSCKHYDATRCGI